MTEHLNTALLDLERTRHLVTEVGSLGELHQIVDQLMRDALAYSRANLANRQLANGNLVNTSLDELIETLANICIALYDSHDIPRGQLLVLVDKVLAQSRPFPARTSH